MVNMAACNGGQVEHGMQRPYGTCHSIMGLPDELVSLRSGENKLMSDFFSSKVHQLGNRIKGVKY
jgi:hypothetical protein